MEGSEPSVYELILTGIGAFSLLVLILTALATAVGLLVTLASRKRSSLRFTLVAAFACCLSFAALFAVGIVAAVKDQPGIALIPLLFFASTVVTCLRLYRRLKRLGPGSGRIGYCEHCNGKVGVFERSHESCFKGVNEIRELIGRAACSEDALEELEARLARAPKPTDAQAREQLISGWGGTVTKLLDAGVISEEQERRLIAFCERFNLTQDDLDRKGAYSRLIQAAVLREIMAGKIPERINTDRPLPFNFQKAEKLIWVFPKVEYMAEQKQRRYAGGSLGTSIRVAKGIYIRPGVFGAMPVESSQMQQIDTGILAVTDRHIYFGGESKSFRVRYDKIVAFKEHGDGLGITRDGANAKAEAFVTGDGWFVHNLVTNVARMGQE